MKDIKEIEIKSYACLICEKNNRNIIFKPCKHFCSCQDCYKKL